MPVSAHPPRFRLHAKIDAALARGAVLVVAGAGFGKTELLSSWAQHRRYGAVAWINERELPGQDWSGTSVMDCVAASAVPLLGDRTRAWRLILVAREAAHPDLSLARLNGSVDVIDADCLRMNHADIAAMFTAAHAQQIERILEITGGWPLAVHAMTAREEQIAACLARGLSNKEIGRCITMSDNTVKWHLKKLFKRFAVESREAFLASYHSAQLVRTGRSLEREFFPHQPASGPASQVADIYERAG